MKKLARRPTIVSPAVHIRSYSFRPFLALILTGCHLSFIGGYINTICFFSFFRTARSSSTGASSDMAIQLAKGNFGGSLHFFLLIFSFVLGSFISAALVGGSSFRISRSYGLVLLLECFALVSSYLFEETAFTFGKGSVSLQVGGYLVSLGCGLQNGMCTTFSGAVIRTTHVSGILTDIGLILGQTTFYPRTRKHLWKLKVLCPLYGCFCFGSFIGWFVYQLLHIKAILLPSAVVGLTGIGHICYCKIILIYETNPINRKHWKRNKKDRLPVPMAEIDENINNLFNQQANEMNQDRQNETEKTSVTGDPFDLQIVSVYDTKTNTIAS